MSNHDTRNEYERIDDLILTGKAEELPVSMNPEIPIALTVHEVPRRAGRRPHYKFRFIAADENQDVEVYVSPTGSSVRVFRNNVELT